MEPRPEYDPDRVAFQVACLDYEKGSRLVSDVLDNMAKMAGKGPDTRTGKAESAFGWTFYPMSISKDMVLRLASLPEIGIAKSKGSTLDQKFSTWLNSQLGARADGVQVRLLSDLKSSQFGLF